MHYHHHQKWRLWSIDAIVLRAENQVHWKDRCFVRGFDREFLGSVEAESSGNR
jgi:hypothetical protein